MAQLELRLHNIRLERLNQNREKMMATIAHDLRSPFNAILNFSQLLANKAEAYSIDKIMRLSQSVLDSSLCFYHNLDELLEWSNHQLKDSACSIQDCHVRKLSQQCLDLLEDNIHIKHLSLDISINDDLIAQADPVLFKVVLRNILANAIKYSPRAGEILLSAQRLNDRIEIQVTDQGDGINDAIESSLFNDYVYNDIGIGPKQGFGLGLKLSADCLRKMHGDIYIKRNHNQTTTVGFTLSANTHQ
jgi:K+-sensing histidine kinase KdpD